jgi:hypothetical protein
MWYTLWFIRPCYLKFLKQVRAEPLDSGCSTTCNIILLDQELLQKHSIQDHLFLIDTHP